MMEIELTRGYKTKVDDETYAELATLKWCWVSGYACRRSSPGGKTAHQYMHKRIMPCGPDEIVIHVDGDRLNNQRGNLSVAKRSIRQQRVAVKARSGFKGVVKVGSRYVASIFRDGKNVCVGRFLTADDAARAYDAAALEYYGPQALFNFGVPKPEVIFS